ncbi:MAG: hypothetical protein M0Z66_16690 [Thermaerobacter sp.]|nr:hypothetical protein [Thermaerobacter sp.]
MPTYLRRKMQTETVAVLVDIEVIEGSTVHRKDGLYSALVEVEGEVFNMLSLSEQDARLEAYARVLNGLPEK